MGARDGWGVDDIRRRCIELKEVLVSSPELCTAEDIAAYWPGGAENRMAARGGWIYCYAMYVAFLFRSKATPDQAEEDEAAAHQATLDAFREKPLVVELVGTGPHGAPATVSVYPKSFDTLSLIDEIDAQAKWLTERLLWLEKQWGVEAALKVPEAMRELTELHLTIVWILTHPGCEAPFTPGTELPPLPAEFRRYDPLDILLICRAHHAINRQRIAIVVNTIRKTGGGEGKASWATLAVGAAKALQEPVERVMRNRSLGAWLSQAAITWDADREAQERARPDTGKAPEFAV